MKVIYKYPLRRLHTGMPVGAKIIHLGLDPSGDACLWAEVDTEAELVGRRISRVGTGHEVPDGKHIGSYVDGPFVWHIYDGGEA